jgi:hypothetical protein
MGVVNGRSLTPNYAGAFAQGSQNANTLKNQRLVGQRQEQQIAGSELAAQQAGQFNKLSGNLLSGQFDEGQDRKSAINELIANNPEKAQSILKGMGINRQAEADEAATFGYTLENTPFAERGALIQGRVNELNTKGLDSTFAMEYGQMNEQQQNQVAQVTQMAALSTAERMKQQGGGASQKPGEGQFTIGNTRYNADGSVLKEGESAPKTETKTSSLKDFETYQELNAKAQRTGDPVDIELAEKFGVQSGFDRLSPQELADIEVDKTSKVALGKQAATASKEAFDSLKKVRTSIANMDDAIAALDKGAETGPIVSKLPSFRESSIELANIKGRMGLDVIGATTFGALSESELAFALNTALPTSLEPKALRQWLVDKKKAQGKMANELRKAASYLGQPGNTVASYLEMQEKADPKNSTDDELKKRLGL